MQHEGTSCLFGLPNTSVEVRRVPQYNCAEDQAQQADCVSILCCCCPLLPAVFMQLARPLVQWPC